MEAKDIKPQGLIFFLGVLNIDNFSFDILKVIEC